MLRRTRPFRFWQSVTGSLEAGETVVAAAARELFEETGFHNEGVLTDACCSRKFSIDPRWRSRYEPGVTENEEFEWHYAVDGSPDAKIDTAEHSEWAWVHIDDAIDKVWSWTNRGALQSLREKLRSRP